MNEGVSFPVPALVTGEGDRAGGGFPNTSMVLGEGKSFFKQFDVFGDRGKQNELMVFQCFPRLTPIAPVPFFLAFFEQKYTLMSLNLVFSSSITTANCTIEAAVNVGHVRLIK